MAPIIPTYKAGKLAMDVLISVRLNVEEKYSFRLFYYKAKRK
ncbi:hypothetical protein HMPREF3224_02135 [Anaerococcus hydrogenalis]|nr:hypothetical protein HMPREF3224_02135 [Anaerococcus hydrogenalis]